MEFTHSLVKCYYGKKDDMKKLYEMFEKMTTKTERPAALPPSRKRIMVMEEVRKGEYEWVPVEGVTYINEIKNEEFNKGIQWSLDALATQAIKEFPKGARFLEAYDMLEKEAKEKGWLK